MHYNSKVWGIHTYFFLLFFFLEVICTMAERAQRCNFRIHMQIERHQQINKTSPSVRQHMCCKSSQPNQIQKCGLQDHNKIINKIKNELCYIFIFAVRFCFCLCCEHLQRLRCQIDEEVFLICSTLSSIGHRTFVYI